MKILMTPVPKTRCGSSMVITFRMLALPEAIAMVAPIVTKYLRWKIRTPICRKIVSSICPIAVPTMIPVLKNRKSGLLRRTRPSLVSRKKKKGIAIVEQHDGWCLDTRRKSADEDNSDDGSASDSGVSRKPVLGLRKRARMQRYFQADDSDGFRCYRCGTSGHMAADCPTEKSACHICGRRDHFFLKCPWNPCNRCLRPGHIAKACHTPSTKRLVPPGVDGLWGAKQPCTTCGNRFHEKRDCQLRRTLLDTAARKSKCFCCGKNGHICCRNPAPTPPQPHLSCFNCGEGTHKGYLCPYATAERHLREAQAWTDRQRQAAPKKKARQWQDGNSASAMRKAHALHNILISLEDNIPQARSRTGP
eukprot:Rmarinus@m.27974